MGYALTVSRTCLPGNWVRLGRRNTSSVCAISKGKLGIGTGTGTYSSVSCKLDRGDRGYDLYRYLSDCEYCIVTKQYA
jgi:hypothetical protein